MWRFAGRSSEPFLKQASFNSSCRQVQEMSGGQVLEEEETKEQGATAPSRARPATRPRARRPSAIPSPSAPPLLPLPVMLPSLLLFLLKQINFHCLKDPSHRPPKQAVCVDMTASLVAASVLAGSCESSTSSFFFFSFPANNNLRVLSSPFLKVSTSKQVHTRLLPWCYSLVCWSHSSVLFQSGPQGKTSLCRMHSSCE